MDYDEFYSDENGYEPQDIPLSPASEAFHKAHVAWITETWNDRAFEDIAESFKSAEEVRIEKEGYGIFLDTKNGGLIDVSICLARSK